MGTRQERGNGCSKIHTLSHHHRAGPASAHSEVARCGSGLGIHKGVNKILGLGSHWKWSGIPLPSSLQFKLFLTVKNPAIRELCCNLQKEPDCSYEFAGLKTKAWQAITADIRKESQCNAGYQIPDFEIMHPSTVESHLFFKVLRNKMVQNGSCQDSMSLRGFSSNLHWKNSSLGAGSR